MGRAPGSDGQTMRALRRDDRSAERFPQDVQELRGYLTGRTLVPGVDATPGKGTDVPLYILGSSLFGARLAAHLGLPYGFASHFAPNALQDAVALYRRLFQPSEQLDAPYVIAGVNVIAADTVEDAQDQQRTIRRQRVGWLLGGGRTFSDDEADAVLASPQGQQLVHMMQYTGAGTPDMVRDYLDWFAAHAEADELIVAHQSPTIGQRLHSVKLTAAAAGLAPAATVTA
nr:MsnO8 family LLM class oxidoreductase [Frankia sp. EI5c]